MENNITKPTVLNLHGNISGATLTRLIKEDGHPKPVRIGRSIHFKKVPVYKWLSEVAGREVAIGDKLLSSKQLESLFSRSSAWVWIHFQKNKTRKEKAIYLRSRPFWLWSEIKKDAELARYLDVAKEVTI